MRKCAWCGRPLGDNAVAPNEIENEDGSLMWMHGKCCDEFRNETVLEE